MTIQFLTSWNGNEFGSVKSLGSAEAGLIAAGIARAWSPGIDPTSDRAAVLRYDASGALVGLVAHNAQGAEVVVPVTTAGALPTPPAAGKVLTSTGNVAGGYTWSDPTGGGTGGPGDAVPVTHTDAMPFDTPGFGKIANSIVDLTNARSLTVAGSPAPRAAYEVTFRGDGNNTHGVTFPSNFVRSSQGATTVSTASQRLSRVLFEYDADIGKVVYVIIDLSGSSAGATAVLMTGPNSGTIGQASSAFTLSVDGDITGSITVTPNDNGSGGAFSPANRTLTAGSPSATFTYTPVSTGVRSISATNTGGLTNPTDIVYVSNPVAATAVTLQSGPSGGTTGVASSPFVFATNGSIAGTLIVTPTSSGGTFSPATLSLTNGSPTGSTTFTPSSAGTKAITVANNGGLTNPSGLSYVSTSAAAVFFEDDLFGAANGATMDGRSPNLSNAKGVTYADPRHFAQGNYGAFTYTAADAEGLMVEMGSDASYRVDITAQLLAGQKIGFGFKHAAEQPTHTNYKFDFVEYQVDNGQLEYWNVGPSWDIFTDVATLHAGDTPGDTTGSHKYSISINDTTHFAQFYIDDVAYGPPRAIRTDSGRNDWSLLGGAGIYISHVKCGAATN